MLYDLENCEHRPWMDRHADPKARDAVSPFVAMLWRRGRAHEDDVVANKATEAILNVRSAPVADRERLTLEAMERREPLIYGGRLCADDLLGEPDLLRLEGPEYAPGDIKSGAGDEGPPGGDRKLKVHYGVQIALYVDVLERLGRSAGRHGFVWDINGDEVLYDLTKPRGPKSPSLWESYEEALVKARAIIAKTVTSRPAYGGVCKQCWWLTRCIGELERADDLTLIHELGRNRREPLGDHAMTISAFAALPMDGLLTEKGKSAVKGFTSESLLKFQQRAILRSTGGNPYLKSDHAMPTRDIQLFFDIETDPSRDHCYLHGFVERRGGDNATEQFYSFFSTEPTPHGEREAFAAAWAYVQSRRPCAIYIYSKYERTWWRGLQERHPGVCLKEDLELLFASDDMVDLYDIVSNHTEWPTRDYALKTLAQFLGFTWRDSHPSGAASIEWYDRYINGEPGAKERILAYNEDDCRATRVLLDGILALRRRDAAETTA
ncbi:MAG: TM0106 family RecB-like putative nuclease [Candidatus Eremiobacteraeota bacterium]|nr:TM0106 family RecB-like putative nuclease [Candidatus Eremiobacteraeota bacterium]